MGRKSMGGGLRACTSCRPPQRLVGVSDDDGERRKSPPVDQNWLSTRCDIGIDEVMEKHVHCPLALHAFHPCRNESRILTSNDPTSTSRWINSTSEDSVLSGKVVEAGS